MLVLRFAMVMVASALVLAFPLTQIGGSRLIEALGQGLSTSQPTYYMVTAIMLSRFKVRWR